jgi:hypothetical protein
MNRFAVRGVIALVGLIVYGIIHFSNKSSAGDQTLHQAHRLVAQVEGYGDKPDYYDWLVDTGHDKVFGDAYYTESHGRYSETARVDKNQYYDELFEWMINQAKTDNAGGVADALARFREQHWHPTSSGK